MIHRAQEKWDFSGDRQVVKESLQPFYEHLEKCGMVQRMRAVMKDLVVFRNGFDHAWTSRVADFQDIVAKGNHICKELQAALQIIEEKDLFLHFAHCRE